MKNPAYESLISLGIVDPSTTEDYCGAVRDRADISVKRCRKSGVIFLDRANESLNTYYSDKPDDSTFVCTTGEVIPISEMEDTARRSAQFSSAVRGKAWLDFGTGRGQILDAFCGVAKSCAGVELNKQHCRAIAARGHRVEPSIDSYEPASLDIITLFHVLEHLDHPVEMLRALSSRLIAGGRMIVEVPHARDALLGLYDCDPFRRFTLWSEHLVLHTRESLRATIEAAGLRCDAVIGYQRYPVSNHLYWLRHGKPGGHAVWSFLDDPALTATYAATLQRIDATDTLIAYATKADDNVGSEE